VSTQGITLGNVSTFTNSTNTLLVQVSSGTFSSVSLNSSQLLRLNTISTQLAPTPTGIYVQPVGVSSNGLTPYRTLNLNSTIQQVVSTAATFYGMYFSNSSTTPAYIKVWDGVSSATFVSSTAATLTIAVPTSSTDILSGNFNPTAGLGIRMSTGICVAGVLGANDNNSTAIGSSSLILNLFYKA
jgi:hypothetical protein